jgi:uncharacterized protein YecE (DUF72 family)
MIHPQRQRCFAAGALPVQRGCQTSHGSIPVGTASWTDKSLIDSGKFYPRDAATPQDRLRYYASQFPMVEVDSSTTRFPPHDQQLWAERTPREFTFLQRQGLSRSLLATSSKRESCRRNSSTPWASTAETALQGPRLELQRELWRLFFAAIEPLRLNGKLGASFSVRAVDHLRRPATQARRALRENDGRPRPDGSRIPQRSWWTDEPRLHSPPSASAASSMSSSMARKASNQRAGGGKSPPRARHRAARPQHRNLGKKGLKRSSDRFNYDTRIPELEEIAQSVEILSQKVPVTHVVANNLCGAPHKLFNAESIVMCGEGRQRIDSGRPPMVYGPFSRRGRIHFLDCASA